MSWRTIFVLLFVLALLAGCESAAQLIQPTPTPAPPTETATPRPPPPTPTPDLRPRYIVQSGDSLWAIAARHGVSIEELKQANRWGYGKVLTVDMEMIIPIEPTPTITPTASATASPTPLPPDVTPSPPPPTDTPTNTPTPDPRIYHEVVSGDSWWLIAANYGIEIEKLVAANQRAETAALMPGQQLVIPVTKTPTSTPSFRTATPTGTATPIPTATPTSVPFTPPPVNPPADVAEWPHYLADLINEQRFAHGLPPLRWSPVLAQAAQAHADECRQLDQCSHTGADGSDLDERLQRVGYQARWASENWVFVRFPEQALIWWYDEPPGNAPHRKNLLSPNYTEIGIGMAQNQWGMWYVIADFGSTE